MQKKGTYVAPLTLFRAGKKRSDLHPLSDAASAWGSGAAMRGMAVSAALAREALHRVREDVGDGWTAGRWTVDFGRPALMEPSSTRARTVRRGRRLTLVEVEMTQAGDRVVAWGRGAFLRPAHPASGRVWEPSPVGIVAPPDLCSEDSRLYWSTSVGWTADSEDHQGADRKGVWQHPFEIVEGERTEPFPLVAGTADIASMVTQWGNRGVQHINLDLSLHLVRVPVSIENGIGVASLLRAARGGQAIGTAAIFDSVGMLGTAAVTALQNEAQAAPAS